MNAFLQVSPQSAREEGNEERNFTTQQSDDDVVRVKNEKSK